MKLTCLPLGKGRPATYVDTSEVVAIRPSEDGGCVIVLRNGACIDQPGWTAVQAHDQLRSG